MVHVFDVFSIILKQYTWRRHSSQIMLLPSSLIIKLIITIFQDDKGCHKEIQACQFKLLCCNYNAVLYDLE